ncbi:hypothetical protein X975_08366, partial [Stegodyphus mimosarum]
MGMGKVGMRGVNAQKRVPRPPFSPPVVQMIPHDVKISLHRNTEWKNKRIIPTTISKKCA